ncbi:MULTISPECIES: small acid-soluble spore protein Tlp [Heyndrickxia]|jgi:small acid-soluble spore protein (thioredoxin-like protein)|uniref:Small, acid-soluble spore protein Tlp n=1 Tax=Heyndrickxia oleronia TaxID=38875 RepID=A0A8E2LCY6_9BACI|nr:small acid-soluble spore protein Tlp [Heyndrickxia oleronia]NYV64965.1 small acid-soluble spore protein Tlp [Bacillus sp. Gen3]OJH19453.1 small acid-soluble spore protein Tlp [Bacillus obstructivus]MBU5210352.1 small acid-soluble spore protein Tlp [Heyndrickxia oleronia]MCI1590749.1 small acid-soluble spore protein Tlp [Heyndrickxia oleronia]MCI1612062.1 small acid-soluble spore protein Tlp [Heyndrickxia oleronia]
MAWNKPKPDDRSDNVEKLQNMIDNTLENIEKAEETASLSSNEERAKIEAKNERRRESIESMRSEVKDEAHAQNNQYQ